MPQSISLDNLSSEYQVTRDNTGTIIAKATKTISSSSVAFLPATLNDATTHVFWQVVGADINVELAGGTATTADMKITNGNSTIWSRQMALDTNAIRNDTDDATLIIYELQKASPTTAGRS